MKYVKSGNDRGIEVGERQDGKKKVIIDKAGLPGTIYVKSVSDYVPTDKEKETLDEYFKYYEIARNNFKRAYRLEKTDHIQKVPKEITVHRKGTTFKQIRMVLPETSSAHLDSQSYEKIKGGDQKALGNYLYRALYTNHELTPYAKKSLGGYASKIEPDDVIQDTVMVMLKKQSDGKIKDIANQAFTSYVAQVIQNVAREYYRKYKQMEQKEESMDIEDKPETIESKPDDRDETTTIKEVGQNVMSAIRNPKHKEMFKEYLSSEGTHKKGAIGIKGNVSYKLAEKFGVTPDSARVIIGRINKIVRQEMAKQGYNEENSVTLFRDIYRKKIGKYQELQKARKLAGRLKIHGMDISIETDTGQERSGVDKDGNEWSVMMNFPYGYIRGTIGNDGDHVDVFVGANLNSEKVFIVHQNHPDGEYDEDKVFLGFNDKQSAKDAYFDHYDRKDLYESMSVMLIDDFKELLETKKGQKLEKAKKAEIGAIRTYKNGKK